MFPMELLVLLDFEAPHIKNGKFRITGNGKFRFRGRSAGICCSVSVSVSVLKNFVSVSIFSFRFRFSAEKSERFHTVFIPTGQKEGTCTSTENLICGAQKNLICGARDVRHCRSASGNTLPVAHGSCAIDNLCATDSWLVRHW